jgi:hypothetical protein
MRLYLIFLLCSILTACGDPVARDIDDLIAGGEDAERAKMSLSLAKKSAIAPLIAALQEREHISRARVDMVEALKSLYLREPDERILQALIAHIDDDDPAVRRKIAWAFGDLRQNESVGPLLGQLERETDNAVRMEILLGLEIMGMSTSRSNLFDSEVSTEKMDDEERKQFTRILGQLAQQDLGDSLRLKTLEWLEIVAEEKTVDAHNLMLKADLENAEKLLLEALDLIPDSRNVNQKLGQFYYDNDQQEKGLELLSEFGMVMRVPRLDRPPVIDGILDDAQWQKMEPVTEFFQCIHKLRAYPIEGDSEAYVGWHNNVLYIGVKGYESSTDNLTATAQQRDEASWRDDCVEVFLDVNHDRVTYCQIVTNSLGTIFDQYNDGSSRGGNLSWNGEYEVATQVGEDFWSVEIGITATQFDKEISPGDVWGFNVARIRIANAAEYGQWVPTYGFALRPERFGFLIFN